MTDYEFQKYLHKDKTWYEIWSQPYNGHSSKATKMSNPFEESHELSLQHAGMLQAQLYAQGGDRTYANKFVVYECKDSRIQVKP